MHNVRFDIRRATQTKSTFTGSADARPPYDSIVEISFMIGERRYGRYSTGIRTFRRIWDGRKALRVSAESKALAQQLSVYQSTLELAHDELLRSGRLIDGDLLMKTLKHHGANQKGAAVSLHSVWEEFYKARLCSVETDRKKRKEGQIAFTTLRTYPKRWAMIKLYLDQSKQANLAVGGIEYNHATELKEFLTRHRINGASRPLYGPASINKALSLLKMLLTYAQSKGYIRENVVRSFSCRGGSPANPKPLTEAQLHHLETCELPQKLRYICDSWLIAGELCLHHADYMELPNIVFVTHNGKRYIQHERSKQQGSSLKQTVNLTARAIRLLDKYGGPDKLFYRKSGQFSDALKQIAMHAQLLDKDGQLIELQFGQGRDSGLTARARQGANGIQLSMMAGWSNPRVAKRYLGDDISIVAGFVDRKDNDASTPPAESAP